MSRRPKLNLTPGQEVPKRGPEGFERREAKAEEATDEPRRSRAGPHLTQATATDRRRGLSGILGQVDGRRLAKVALLAAAAGLSLYLLKRRFLA